MNTDDPLYQLTQRVIGCAFQVSNTLGVGFLERVYENSLALELSKAGLLVAQQHPIAVKYDGMIVGEYVADLLVEGTLLVELKSVKAITDVHAAQCMNYLRATGLPLCLLLNFGTPRVEIRRVTQFS
jgi:GxxExxY protein